MRQFITAFLKLDLYSKCTQSFEQSNLLATHCFHSPVLKIYIPMGK